MPFLPGSTGKCLPYSSNIPFVMSERTYRGTLVQVVYAIDPYLTFVEHDKNLFSPCHTPKGRIGMSHDAVLAVMVYVPVISYRQLVYLVINRLFVQ